MSRQPVKSSPTLKEPSAVRYFKKMFIRFGLAKKVKKREEPVLFLILWKRVVLLFVALAFIGYSVLVGGAYYFIKYERDFTEIRYIDLFFPHRWDNYRVSRGDYYIERAQHILQGDDMDGHPFLLLRSGVGLSPENDEGRLALARFYQQIGQQATGIRVLEARLEENSANIEYLQTFFMMLFNEFQDERIIEIGESILAEGNGDTERRDHMVATAVATAYFYRGDAERAQEYISDYALMSSKDGFLLQTRIDWELGAEDLAIRRLENSIDEGGVDHDVFLVLVDYLLASGQNHRATRVALLYHFSDPLSYQPLLGLLQIHHRNGDGDRFVEDKELYFSQFGRDEEALHQLAAVAGQWGDEELTERIYRLCLERGMDTEPPAYHWIEALVASGLYNRALAAAEGWDENPSEWERGYALPLKARLAVAQFGSGNRGEGQLVVGELFGEGFLRPDHFTHLAGDLMELGEYGQARRVLAHVRHNYPLYRNALSKLIELDMETGNPDQMLTNVQRYLGMRQPSTELLRRAYTYLGSDLFIFDREREQVLHSLEDVLGES